MNIFFLNLKQVSINYPRTKLYNNIYIYKFKDIKPRYYKCYYKPNQVN